jgi:hypothetical protein
MFVRTSRFEIVQSRVGLMYDNLEQIEQKIGSVHP